MLSEFEDLMARSGLSKGELADKLSIHPTTISRWVEPPGPVMAYLRLYVAVKESLE